MNNKRERAFDPKLNLEVSIVCQLFPVIVECNTQGLLVKTYLQWLKNPKNPYMDLVDFTTRWVQYERWKRGI